MTSLFSRRTGGICAVLAGVLAVLLLPPVTAAYGVSDAGAGSDPTWGGGFRDAGGSLFTFADPDRVYSTYGLLYLLVTLGLLVGVLAVREARGGDDSALERWGFRLLVSGLVLNSLGLLTDYTVFEGTVVENIGFVVGTLLGVLLLVGGGILVGLRWLRNPAAPRVAGLLLLLSLPGMLLLGLLDFGNLPSMPLTWFGISGIPLGLFLLRSESDFQHSPAAPS